MSNIPHIPEWEGRVFHYMGDFDESDAERAGIEHVGPGRAPEVKGRVLGPTEGPDTLYHATRSGSQVLSDRALRATSETRTGLGGGHGDSVSLYDNPEDAENTAQVLRHITNVAHGIDTSATPDVVASQTAEGLRNWAQEEGWGGPEAEDHFRSMVSGIKSDTPLEEALAGRGAAGPLAFSDITGRFLTTRSSVGGRRNPLLFGQPGVKSFQQTRPEDVGVFTIPRSALTGLTTTGSLRGGHHLERSSTYEGRRMVPWTGTGRNMDRGEVRHFADIPVSQEQFG